MFSKLETIQILKSAVVYLLLFGIGDTIKCKSDKKKIIRSIKKYLVILSKKDPNIYKQLIDISGTLLGDVDDLMVTEEGLKLNAISPAKLVHLFMVKDKELFDLWEISEDTVNSYNSKYSGADLAFTTLMYYNRLNRVIDDRISRVINNTQ